MTFLLATLRYCQPDPHGFDGNNDGVGCETGGIGPEPEPEEPEPEEPDDEFIDDDGA